MGSCFSKKSSCVSSSPVSIPEKLTSCNTQFEKKNLEEETQVKKEIFVIKHRKSHEIDRPQPEEINPTAEIKKIAAETVESGDFSAANAVNGPIRTSSCTKEELDAILIQCGRLSRSSSTEKAAVQPSESGGRKYSGSKRSYDFDNDGRNIVEDDAVSKEREDRQRERRRQSQGRRRTPSREREREQRSGSRERGCGGGGSSGGGRRVSRSPVKRSESPVNSGVANSRPGKLVSVPAMAIDKSTNGGGEVVKRVQVKINVGPDGASGGSGCRTVASPRARSPAKIRENQQQPMSLSRSNSRKAEVSPYRRNPLGEIDTNIISQAPTQKPNPDNRTMKVDEKKLNTTKLESNITNANCKTKEESHVGLNVIPSSVTENLKPPTLTRTRSSRLSRDLDNITPETSYTALLLEDIQNFHQKNTTTPTPTFTLPPCMTKACSILEAVADLNSSTSSTFPDRKRNPIIEQINNKNPAFVESEIVADDDLMEPSFHKYVTVRRGTMEGVDLEKEESSGSNSFVSSQLVSSCWEPNSAESTDRWNSSSSRSGGVGGESGKRLSAKRRDLDSQPTGIGRARIGSKAVVAGSATAGST